MFRLTRVVGALYLFAFCIQPAHAFQHPGIPLTISDLNTLKSNLTTQPWASGYAALVADGHSSTNYTMQGPYGMVARNLDGGGTSPNLSAFENDMKAALYQSLMWYFTSNSAYAQKSHDILMAWANTMTNLTGYEGPFLTGGDAPLYITSADILRGTWPGWTMADMTNYCRYLTNVFWPETFVPGTVMSANQGGYEMMGAVPIAVFCDDTNKFNQAIASWVTDADAGFRDTLPNGEVGDTQRDQGHSFGMIWQEAWSAEVCWKQGMDIFSYLDNRILATAEYYCRYNLPGPAQAHQFFGATYVSGLYSVPGGNPRSSTQDRSVFNMVHGAYVTRMGVSAPWTTLYRNDQPEDADSFIYRKSADVSTATNKPTSSFPPTASLTTGLTSANLNGATPSGSTVYNSGSGTWTLSSGYGGVDPWGTAGNDSVRFAYKQITGDFTMIARVTSVANVGSGSAKAGIMLRDSLGTSSSRFWIAITPNVTVERAVLGWTNMQYGQNIALKSIGIPQMPYWVKVERVGNRVQGFHSPNGADWSPSSVSDMAAMPATIYVGLFGASMVSGTASTATFDNVRITGGDGGETPKIPPAPFAIYAAPGDAQVPIRWNEAFNATGYNVKRSLTSGSGYTTIATVTGTTYTDTNAANGTNYFYVVTATNSAGEGTNSIEDSATPQLAMVNVAVGGGATATAEDTAGGQGAAQAFDSNPGTKWFASATNGWLQYDLGPFIRQTVRRYAITSANDVTNRDPVAWQFLASNDGSTWTTLDTQINQSFPYRYQTLTYPINNTNLYRFYRLNITANNGDAGSLQLSELALLAIAGTGTNIATSALVWSGTVNGTWDTSSPNWLSNGVVATYQNGSVVMFDDTATGSTTVSNTASVSPAAVSLNNSSKAYTFSGSAIAGATTIQKTGGGTVTFNSTNTFSNGISIFGGNVTVANNSALGTGAIVLGGGTLFGAGSGVSLANTIQAQANTASTIDCSVNFTLNGSLAGSGTITRGASAAQTLFLVGDNSSFTGTYQDQNSANSITRWNSANAGSANARWIFNQAQVASRTTPNFGTGTIQFGSISGGGYIYQNTSGTATLQVGALGLDDTFSGSIQNGAGFIALTKVGAGTLTMTGANSYSGLTTIDNGELVVATSFSNKGSCLVTNGATFGVTNLSTASATISNLTLAAGCALEFFNVTNLTAPLLVVSNFSAGANCTVMITGTNGLIAGSGYPLLRYIGAQSGFTNLQLQSPYGWRGTLANNGNQFSLTNVAVVSTVPPPMTVTNNGSQLQLSWPTDRIGWRLQAKTNLSDSVWSDIAGTATTNFIALPMTNNCGFFRLIYP